MPFRFPDLAQRARDLSPLVLVGLALVLAGAVADVVFHLLAPPLSPALNTLLGVDGRHAHLLTLAGMLVTVFGLVVQARSSSPSF